MSDSSRSVWFVDRERRRADVTTDQVVVSYPLNAIPDALYEPMASALDGDLHPQIKIQSLYESTLMKPAVCTLNVGGPFPINTATKIVRLTLTDDAIDDKLDEMEGQLLAFQGRSFKETLQDRIELYRNLYQDDRRIDRLRLGAVEMFRDVTYTNIQRDPRAALNFCWTKHNQQDAIGYQLNCVTEISRPGEPFYRFMRCLRSLFSFKFLEMRGTEYTCAYKFWVCEAKEKSLMPKPGFLPHEF